MTTTEIKQNPFREYTELFYFEDIPADQQEEVRENYDHLGEDDFLARPWLFVPMGKYAGYYHMSDFLVWGTPWTGLRPAEYSGFSGYHNSPLGFDSYNGTTEPLALLIKISPDNDRYFLAWSNELPPAPECLIEDRHGRYIPQLFTEAYGQHLTPETASKLKEELEICRKGPDEGFYWECWEEIENYSELEIDGQGYILHQDQDLWAIPQGFDPEPLFDLQQE
jgi:hypothetical protein